MRITFSVGKTDIPHLDDVSNMEEIWKRVEDSEKRVGRKFEKRLFNNENSVGICDSNTHSQWLWY